MGSISSWSDLPLELLSIISNSLKTRIDNSRFRSVCTSWRSSTPPFKNPFQFSFDLDVEVENPTDFDDHNSDYFRMTEKTVYCLEPRTPQPSLSINNWLIVVNEFKDGRKVHLLNPFTGFPIQPLPSVFPKELDLSNFHIIELKKVYRLELNTQRSFADMSSCDNIFMVRKVVFLPHPTYDEPLLAVLQFYGNLSFYKLENKRWTLVHNICDWPEFTDIGSYEGKVCANSVIVDSSFNIAVIEKSSPSDHNYSYLVESSDDLYLVEIHHYFSEDPWGITMNTPLKKFLLVYKLHELDGHKWSKVTHIDGQVFFLGQKEVIAYWSFCVSSHQISACKGNCIFFTDYSGYFPEQSSLSECYHMGNKLSVFDMETGKYGLLGQFPGYADVIWPPPEWLNV